MTGACQYLDLASHVHRQLGRFASRDPVGYAGSPSGVYEYVGDMPTKRTDPTGLAGLCRQRCDFFPARWARASNGYTHGRDSLRDN